MTDRDDSLIDGLLADVAQRPVPAPSDDLMARIVQDAAAVSAVPPPATAAPERAGWRSLYAALGGWPAMGSMVAAGLAGLWIGVSPTAGVDGLMAGVWGDTVSVDLLSGVDVLSWELDG